MPERFVQKKIPLTGKPETSKLKVSRLLSLLDKHPYKKQVFEAFKTEAIKDEYIVIDNIETVFNKIRMLIKQYERSYIYAYRKDVNLVEAGKSLRISAAAL
jgi:cytochrome c peroxidase